MTKTEQLPLPVTKWLEAYISLQTNLKNEGIRHSYLKLSYLTFSFNLVFALNSSLKKFVAYMYQNIEEKTKKTNKQTKQKTHRSALITGLAGLYFSFGGGAVSQ